LGLDLGWSSQQCGGGWVIHSGVNGDFYVFKERLAWLIAEHDLLLRPYMRWTLRAISTSMMEVS